MVRIVVKRFGNVGGELSDEILGVIRECYNRLQPHTVQIVDLYLFQRSSTMNAFLSQEKKHVGIATSPFDESFLATHDAWRGTSRIMVALDRFSGLPRLVQLGVIRHETAHTVLHGSPEYYIFPIPKSLFKLERLKILPRQSVLDLLYLVSITVKDYEVTRLLCRKDYVEDQVAYSKHILESSDEEMKAWNLAQTSKTARLFVLVSPLKTICCVAPLMGDERFGGEVMEAVSCSMNYLPEALLAKLLRLAKIATDFGDDTYKNVEMFTNRIISKLVEEEALQ